MKNSNLLLKQKCLFLILLVFPFLLSSCSDEVETTVTYTVQEPVYMLRSELKEAVKVNEPQGLENPGKIYAKGDYLFINELDKGIHIINNSNPAAPHFISFINIPGNIDLAIKDNILYADSYIDFVALDISNPQDVKLIKRIENIFPSYGMYVHDTTKMILTGFKEKIVTETVENFNNRPSIRGGFFEDTRSLSASPGGNPGGGKNSGAGKGGSMARFTISGNHLYTVGQANLQVFDVTNAADPIAGTEIALNWGIETIFPYEDKLFIGSTTGMHIYDNSDPDAPQHLSTYEHVRSCDPVVVEGNLAWVTLRSGTECEGFTNQLEVLDISDARSPQLLKVYPMENPHGLGIDGSSLFLCEGEFGLKVFDIKDHLKVDENLMAHFKEHDAYDVIPLGTSLLLIGKDGLYQYSYSNPTDIKLLSKIPVNKSI